MTKSLDGTAVYAYTTLVSVLICVPWALMAEGSTLIEGAKAAIAKVGAQRFYLDLFMVGMLYHLYNQVSYAHTRTRRAASCRAARSAAPCGLLRLGERGQGRGRSGWQRVQGGAGACV